MAEVDGHWLALLSWSAAANHLRDRENWIGWDIMPRRRLALVANNARFLILPGVDCPNLASRVLSLCGLQLADDWQRSYGNYWEIESGLHQRLDVTAAEDASRVRNRNGLLVLGILRRFNNRHAFATITSPRR